jgi:hypothetical protein
MLSASDAKQAAERPSGCTRCVSAIIKIPETHLSLMRLLAYDSLPVLTTWRKHVGGSSGITRLGHNTHALHRSLSVVICEEEKEEKKKAHATLTAQRACRCLTCLQVAQAALSGFDTMHLRCCALHYLQTSSICALHMSLTAT